MGALGLIVRSTLGRIVRRRRSLWLFLLSGAAAPILLLVAWRRDAGEVADLYANITFNVVIALVFPVVGLVLSTAALGGERREQTLPFLLLKPVSRWVIALGAVVAAACASFLILETGVLATWLVASIRSGDWSVGIPTTVAAAIQSVASAAVFVPLGLVLRRATLAGLGYLLIWDLILTSVIEGIQGSSIFRIVLSGWADLASLTPDTYGDLDDTLGRITIGLGGAVAKVAVMAAVSVILTGMALRHRDLVGE